MENRKQRERTNYSFLKILNSVYNFLQVAHNNRGFDSLVLTTNLLRFDLELPENVIMADSFDLTNHNSHKTKRQSIYALATISLPDQYHNISKAFILRDRYKRFSSNGLQENIL